MTFYQWRQKVYIEILCDRVIRSMSVGTLVSPLYFIAGDVKLPNFGAQSRPTDFVNSCYYRSNYCFRPGHLRCRSGGTSAFRAILRASVLR